MRKLKNGVYICPEIRLDAYFDVHNGIATYLATDEKAGNALVSMYLASEGASSSELEKAVSFYRDTLHLDARCGTYEDFVYFSEPFPFGEYMYEWLERRERVPLVEAIKRVISLLKVLSLAHAAGLYHGRLTPNSVLLERTGDTFDLRMMGLGISQQLAESRRLDINWLDFTINLKGMTPQAVDIYGMAIVLMGLVSGEQGIGSFEATGLLPPMLRSGHLQQAMERALGLRVDTYGDVLTFSQDLEAALLELDERQGEVYVGDLVGFESAVRSLANISEDGQIISESSGVWSSLVNNLEQEARSSLLCSLTSLTAIKAIGSDEDADEDVTRVSSMPESVLNLRRIHSSHAGNDGNQDGTVVTSGRPSVMEDADGEAANDASVQDSASIEETPSVKTTVSRLEDIAGAEVHADNEKTNVVGSESISQTDTSIKGSESDDSEEYEDEDEDEDEEEDDAPTRVMKRPNYQTIRLSPEEAPGVHSAIEEVLASADEAVDAKSMMVKRIREAEVIESSMTLSHNVVYDPNDMLAFPFDAEMEAKENAALEAIEAENAQKQRVHQKSREPAHHGKSKSRGFTRTQRFILCALTLIVFIMILFAIIIALKRMG